MPIMPSDAEFKHVISQIVSDMHDPRQSAAHSDFGVIDVEQGITRDGFNTFDRAGGCSMMAVDGGSASVLDAGSFVVAAVRVGSALYADRQYVPGTEQEMHLLHLSASELASAYSIFFGKTVGGEPPDVPRGLDEALGRIRTLLEWKHLEDILRDDIPSGTVLAFDGALWAGIKGIGDMLARIVDSARKKRIILCGISKKSMLTHLSRPLIPAVQMAGDAQFPNSMWFYRVDAPGYSEKLYGEVYVARFHPRSGYAFRVDLALPPGIEPTDAMARIAYHANDPTYAGYPYPLARAHNDVAFSRSEVEGLRSKLRDEALGSGMDPAEWQLTFQNFHDVLDMNR
ncbi:MAG: DNA double-strand break repair nuclease NurA [Candidatus Thermoplasmatota archaeon]|nr:DNA double-strand break repair nuclease NurA [Euryarchaeota archaeon]MBU4033014.1 DNA double-strand break repair nuclease NurA [Candidatus Thermoplasmatota archaeon]MBU4070636.1 DNA double-strand break repair nuclease NurA [Candidatus Thermoplasmatota archaeon]MBU4145131.1 DNA double-strand break repair nuclease NurA [Candidatus Thermoplasmatota archaeon]MBU4591581.1 DNA double-strand break repair nuclease NurA [Candidatus Thermoplasmatota archaeon]